MLSSLENIAKASDDCSKKRMTAWRDIVREYPNKFILFTDAEVVRDSRIFMCEVLDVCDGNKLEDLLLDYEQKGIHAQFMKADSSLI